MVKVNNMSVRREDGDGSQTRNNEGRGCGVDRVGGAGVAAAVTVDGSRKKKKNNKLLILDVNGVLIDIVRTVSGGYETKKRPFCEDFLHFCLENFDVGIWSSAPKKYLDSTVDDLLGDEKKRLIFSWDKSYCTKTGFMTPENKYKQLVCKELKKVWGNEFILDGEPWLFNGYYNESNTLLVDDSPYKSLLNPAHSAIFPDSYDSTIMNDNSLGRGGDLRVYLEGLASADEDVRKYVEDHPFGQRAIDETCPNWEIYSQIIASLTTNS